jgi:hypothetical protein
MTESELEKPAGTAEKIPEQTAAARVGGARENNALQVLPGQMVHS